MENKKQILIIDDDAVYTEIITFNLEKSGFSVISALTGQEGLRKARFFPDIILLDITIPDMDGFEVCQKLKEDEISKFIPVVMLTVRKETKWKAKAVSLGIVDYLNKDMPMAGIIDRIKAILRQPALSASPGLRNQRNKRIQTLLDIITQQSVKTTFQPIVHLADKKTIGYEALIHGPEASGLEDAFILFRWAYEANKFWELDEIYRSQALKKAGSFPPELSLFLRTDPVLIEKESFKNIDFLKQTTIKPAQLCLELSSHTCVNNQTGFLRAAADFKSKGFKVVLDDVGEGYASTETIAELEPDFIRLGTFLTRRIPDNPDMHHLIQAIVKLAQEMGTSVIANGIETEEECSSLQTLGVNYGQGTLLGNPL